MPPRAAPTRLDDLVRSPFARLSLLLEGIAPGASPIDLSLGEPKATDPALSRSDAARASRRVRPLSADQGHSPFARSDRRMAGPPLSGARRDSDRSRHAVLPLNGSREGLFSAIFPAMARKPQMGGPAVLIPNPFYQAYAAAAAASGADAHLPAEHGRGGLPARPRCDRRSAAASATAAFYLCTPSNPQGAVASRSYLARAIALARRFDFLLFADECYSEIYGDVPPPGDARDGLCRDRKPRQRGDVQLAVEAFGAAGLQIGVRRRRSRSSSPRSAAFATSPARKCRCPCSTSRPRPGPTSAMSRRGARSTAGISPSPTSCSRAATATAARGELLSLAENGGFRGRRRGRENPLERVWCQSAAGQLISHKPNPTASIRARTISGSRWCKTRTPHARP